MSDNRFYRVDKIDERYVIVDQNENKFFSIGLNHTDDTNLKYPNNIEIWERKYGTKKFWIKNGLVSDMKMYGFNTIGWTQEVIMKQVVPCRGSRHSYGWNYEEYIEADMPYCVNLEIADISGWNLNPDFPDVFSRQFEDWCMYLARKICYEHRNSKNLIGYFFNDVPAWKKHRTGKMFPQLKDINIDSLEYDEILGKIAEKYFSTVTKAIRAYDKNHLILGDRFNGNGPNIDVVYKVAEKYCDIISIQYFTQGNPENHNKMLKYFDHVYEITKKPLLLADIGNKCPTDLNPDNSFIEMSLKNQAQRAEDYINSIKPLANRDYLVGWHWCAYIENNQRGWGIKNELDEPYTDFTDPVSEFNKSIMKQKTV